MLFFFKRSLYFYWLNRLLEGDEVIGAGGRKARPATLHGFVGTMENSRRWWQISHLRLDFHLCERLADLDAHHAAHYLGENDAVPQVPLHPLWLLGGWCLSVGPVQALQQVPLTPLLLGILQLHHSDSCWEDVSSSWSRYTPW